MRRSFTIRPAASPDEAAVLALVPRLRAFESSQTLREPEALDAGEPRRMCAPADMMLPSLRQESPAEVGAEERSRNGQADADDSEPGRQLACRERAEHHAGPAIGERVEVRNAARDASHEKSANGCRSGAEDERGPEIARIPGERQRG